MSTIQTGVVDAQPLGARGDDAGAAERRTRASIRQRDVTAGIRIEVMSIAWMIVEGAVAIGAGLLAHSVLLTAFGIDSVIELVTGGVLLWRLLVESGGGTLERVEAAERRAAWVTGIALALLCVYVVVTAAYGLVTQAKPGDALAGLALAVASLILMPLLARRKWHIAMRLDSAALRGDAACSATCAYMAGALLAGLCLHTLLGWWWAEDVAALGFLYWLLPEARGTLSNARAGKSGCCCEVEACSESTQQ